MRSKNSHALVVVEDVVRDPEAPAEIERPKIQFSDVGGMESLKEEIRLKIIYPLTHADMFKAYGKSIGGGILMYGPPGCGKTHLARATAGEAGLLPALVFGLLAIPSAAIFLCAPGWPRWVMILITLGLTAAGLTAVIMITFVRPLIDSPLGQLATGALSVFILGTFVSQWIANWLVSQRPQR